MKKLMIAAAAAAMIGGAQAAKFDVWCNGNRVAGCDDSDGNWVDYNNAVTNGTAMFEPYEVYSVTTNANIAGTTTPAVTNTYKVNVVALDQLQIYTFKDKASKFFCLNTEKNDIETFYKPSAVSTSLATDGAIYYDGEAWVRLEWNKYDWSAQYWRRGGWRAYSADTKDQYKTAISNYYAGCKGNMIYKGTAPETFECFLDKGGKKVWAVRDLVADATMLVNRKGVDTDEVYGLNGGANEYGQYDEKTGLVKSLKVVGNATRTVKLTTYKDEKARDKAFDAILKKFEKAGGKIEFKK